MPLLPTRNSKPIKLIHSSRFIFFYLVVWPISAWHHPPPSCNPAFKPLWPAVGLCGLLWARCAGAGREPGGGSREVHGKSGASAAHTHTHTHTENCYPALREEHMIACLPCLAQLSTKPLHAFVCIICACQLFWLIQHFSFWFHDSHYFFCSFHDGPATEQAATCEWLYATETDNDGCHVAGREHI